MHIVDRTPLILQNVQTYPPTKIDIWMEDGCLEQDCWWGIWVGGGKLEGELEGEGSIGRVRRAGDGGSPVEEIFW